MYRPVRLSVYEREYIIGGAEASIRSDGRKETEYRDFSIELGVVSNAYGSARVDLHSDTTVVMTAVKAELVAPLDDRPDEGKVEFSVECSPVVGPGFEGHSSDFIGLGITHLVKKTFLTSPNAFNTKSLCVLSGRQNWCLYVDTLILQMGGNLVDVVMIAIRAALENTRLPRTTIVEEGEVPEIEISDDPTSQIQIDTTGIPLCVTLHKVGIKVLVDARRDEETCSRACMHVIVNQTGKVCGMHMSQGGSFTPKQVLSGVERAVLQSKAMFESIREKINAIDVHRDSISIFLT
ncbi:Exosome complex component RRP42-like [Oopsacas minuta]|uniref:Ribosomal RNA-processing protein 42 n=1 Tax=Oopsacas minuta TaxID=111878 RepID=A0AAV7JZN7_9METZ|nr:Exosome complex component RRP42-like [Oopsacas minuta]